VAVVLVSAFLLFSAAPGLATDLAPSSQTFIRLYENVYAGAPVDTSASDIAPTADGGYVAAGVTGGPTGYPVGWILKLDASGKPEWSEEVGAAFTYPTSIEPTADGGYVVAGGTQGGSGAVCDPLSGRECAFVIKLDSLGGVEWQKVYATGDSTLQVAWEIRQTPDGGYVVAGNSGYQTEYGAWIAKLDPAGDVEWQKVFGGTSQYDLSVFESVQPTADGGYVATGWSTARFDAQGMQELTVLVAKLDSGGEVIWQEQYSNFDAFGENIGGARADAVALTPDGGYLVAGGWANRGNPGGSDYLLLKLDPNGDIQWQKAYDGGVRCYYSWLGYTCVRLGGFVYSVRPSPDGGYLLSGFGWAVIGDPVVLIALEAWLGKVDANGNVLWHNTYFPTYGPTGLPLATNTFYDVGATADGGVVAIASTTVYETQEEHLYVVKADANGNVGGCGEVHAGVPLTALDPSLVANEVSLPVSTDAASVATAAGDALLTSASMTQTCGGGEPAPIPRPPRRKLKKNG